MTQTTKSVTIRRTEYKHSNPQCRVGQKCGKGFVAPYSLVVRWEVSVDGKYAFSSGSRRFAKSRAERAYPGASISFTRKDLDNTYGVNR